jgi:hypothetical protein
MQTYLKTLHQIVKYFTTFSLSNRKILCNSTIIMLHNPVVMRYNPAIILHNLAV